VTIRLLQIIPTLDRGGAEKQLALLCCGLPREEFDVRVAVLTRGGPLASELREAGIPIHEIGKRRKIDFAAYWRLKRLIRELRPDAVHTWIFAANSYGRRAAFACGTPVVIAGERSVDPWKRWRELAIDRWLAKRTTQLVTNSSGVVEFYAKRGIDAESFTVIPNGVAAPTPPRSRAELLSELNLPGEAVLIGAVGRLWPQKRYPHLLDSFGQLKATHPQTHFLIFGDGPDRESIVAARDRLNLSECVHLLGHRDDAAQCTAALNCFWIGSGYEGQPNSVMEAMSLGVPVVASDIAGNRDLVVDGETGFLVGLDDAAGRAERTLQILSSGDLAAALGTAARTRMNNQFTVERMVEQYAELYQRLV
jgi:glycosyltransferase involved in cell wall biosynthesis